MFKSLSRINFSTLVLILLLSGGFALRLYDLTDQPLDFHPTRQLRGAIITRGIYYRLLPGIDPELRKQAAAYGGSTGQYEPPILENIVAWLYLLTGNETLWLARIINAFVWLLGGLGVYGIGKRIASSWAGFLGLAYYLFLPFAVQASRSFQPDPAMTAWIILAAYFFLRWSEDQPGAHAWKWAIAAGLFGGAAILTKPVAAYILGSAAAAVILQALGLRKFWRSPQMWSMAALMLLPTAIYLSTRGGRASDYLENWTLSLSHLLLEPSLYVRWLNFVQNLMGFTVLLLAFLGILLARGRARALLAGLGLGYLLYGFSLPYQMYTHSYYHLQLVPILAACLAPAAAEILAKVTASSQPVRIAVGVIALAAIGFQSWISIADLKRDDFRSEPIYWQEIASYLPDDGKIIALTQDYGYRLMYYGWRKVELWPTRGERTLSALRGRTKEFDDYFTKQTEDRRYFLITAMGQLNDQPDLKQLLSEGYSLVAQGDGYLIYDLAQPK